MLTESRKEQFRRANEKRKAKILEAGIVRKTISLKPGEVVKIIKEDDFNQFDLVGDTSVSKLQSVSSILEQWRNNPKVNLYANMNKNLLTLIQQLEGVL
jgi:hypothetical protein